MKNKKSIASMIRGKCIEEGIRFAFLNKNERLSVSAAQNYANDLYYLKTKNLPARVVKFNARPINILVKTGINAFARLGIKKIKRKLESFKIRVAKKRKYIYPDFKSSYIRINGENFKDCCLELKVSGKLNRKYEKKHILQCAKYSTKSRKPVILFYLFHFKKAGKFNQFSAISKVFMIKAY